MKFSIVITTYNRLTLLKRAVQSALSQSVACEIIIADDYSSDGTEDYARSLGDRVIYYRNPANLGHSATINAGIGIATGDWIKLVDDDDYLAPNCIEEIMRAIALRPEAIICSCQAIQVDETEHEIGRTRYAGPGKIFYVPQEDIHYGMLLEQVPFGTPVQVAFRRDAFLKSGGWDSTLDTNFDDIDSWIKIAQFGDALFVNQPLTYRTIWQGARNRQFPIERRLANNILIKERIYALVNYRYRNHIPKRKDIRNYLRLHWSIVALKQKQVLTAIKIALPAIFSYSGWRLLWLAVRSRRSTDELVDVRKIILLKT
jgi:glycosyltransferase involved in cell wall biosynthesis